ncbi:glycoside hydrolase family 5 protein [Tulasnella calospora MUT 4182]|uniref:glucan 1,3-beta-glucosidase n=1 Tax=Tulasnella calospora MUT 4182 TaxID=1051891 RepID=A0A0C3QKJ0_9AGAM|nr:glycoside hydrolase family 5 protein [Tulasnella calospora MUT 4182]
MEETPLARPISTFSAIGGDRFSRALTLVGDAPAEDVSGAAKPALPTAAEPAASGTDAEDLQPPTVFANRASAAFGDASPSRLSVADSAQVPAAHLPYRDSLAPTAAGSAQNLGDSEKEAAASSSDAVPRGTSPFPDLGPQSDEEDAPKKKRKKLFFILGGVALVVVAAAVAVPVALTQTKKSSSGSSSSSPSSSGPTGSGNNDGPTSSGPTGDVTGGDGSIITTEKGTTFTYVNKFGGTWYDDPNDPWNNNAQAQSWSPPLSQEWDYQNHPMRGVNLGGWLVPEPFIVPSLYEPYMNATPPAQDEWTLSLAMAADTANGGLNQLETHYDTFITEEDFAQIAGAGLNWIRLPIPFWMVSKLPEEPFLERVSWKYALKAFKWARKYGLRIQLDLHSIPGSQNGFDHSGKGGVGGEVNFLVGPMGLANAQRTLDVIRVITEFVSQPEYTAVVPMFGIINEAQATRIGDDQIVSFFAEVHDMMRSITGTGAGKGPWISIHDAFRGLSAYKDFLPGHDRIALDTHPYLMFGAPDRTPLSNQINKPCTQWAAGMNSSWNDFGFTLAGEFSLGVNDCGRWINGVGQGTRWEGTYQGGDGTNGDCTEWNDYASWTQDRKDDFKTLAMNSFDALGHWFFWTWKIGASSITGKIETPMWSYSLGLKEGWIPEDPSQAVGACKGTNPVTPLTSEMIGASGPGVLSASVKSRYPWPPTSLNPGALNAANLPVYTPTGPIPTLPMPTPTKGTADGWFDDADTRPMYTPIAGCSKLPSSTL